MPSNMQRNMDSKLKESSKMAEKKKEPMVTAVLSNGLVVRIPLEGYKETLRKMEENIKYNKKK